VAIQSLPVRMALDRAGLVGADGATHAGSFDLAYLGCLPGIVLMAPSDEAELAHAVATLAGIDDRPSAVRFPRGDATGLVEVPKRGTALPLGQGRILREGSRVALLALGPRLHDALKAAESLDADGISCTVADARFAKPLDADLLEQLARHHELLVTIEDGSTGGFASLALHHLAWKGLLDGRLKVRPMTLPDSFIDHDTPAKQLATAGLTTRDIIATVRAALG
jgi:1-deoxy-D-xylulose-5-phosphate synthase